MGRGKTNEARPVLRSEDVPPGPPTAPTIRQVTVDGVDLLVTRAPTGDVVAFQTHCPHQGTPLLHAGFWEGALRCPQHRYAYDIRTGANVFPSREVRPDVVYRLKPGFLTLYPVEEREGWIYVSPRPKPPPSAEEERKAATAMRVAPPVEGRVVPAPPGVPQPAAGHPREPQVLTAAEGAEFELALPTVVQPGHVWRIEVPEGRVSVVEQTFDAASSTYRVRLRAGEPGRATIRCSYAKPWGSAARDVRAFIVEIS